MDSASRGGMHEEVTFGSANHCLLKDAGSGGKNANLRRKQDISDVAHLNWMTNFGCTISPPQSWSMDVMSDGFV